jgi:hypothetical protein
MIVVLSLVVLGVGDEARKATWLLQLSADLPKLLSRVSHFLRPATAYTRQDHMLWIQLYVRP